MNRKTLTALAAFVVLGVLALVALRQPEKGEKVVQPSPIPAIDPARVDTLEVTKAGATTVIKRDAGKYKVTAPIAYAADEPAAKAAFDGIGKLHLSDLVTEQKPKQAEFEVDDKGLRVVAKSGDKVLADLIVGKSTGPGTMVRPNGKDEIWQATGISKYTFDKAPIDWCDKSITTFTAADAERVEVAAKDGAKVTVKKTGGKAGATSEDKWEVVESSLKIDKLDDSVPNGIVSSLASWKANDFGTGAKPADTGLDAPALTVTVGLKGGKKVTVLLGNKKGEDEVYVKTADAPQVFVAKKFNVERVNKRPVDFRDKTLCNVADTDVTEIAVTHGDQSYTVVKNGSDWKATKPAKLDVDASKVTPIAGAFKDWKGNGFAEDPSPKATGLVKPKAVIVVKAKAKGDAGCLVKVGDETKDKLNYLVMAGKGPDVVTAPKWNVDRILVKTDDLKKAGGVAKK